MIAIAQQKKRGPAASVWTPERVQYLRDHYPNEGAKPVAKALGTTAAAISYQCAARGIKRAFKKPKPARGRPINRKCRNPIGVTADPINTAAQATDRSYAKHVAKMDAADERSMWDDYILGGRRNELLRNRLLQLHLRELQALAFRTSKRVPTSVDIDDLIQVGWLGMVQCSATFDTGRGFGFWTYAARRVIGAMQDWMREQDHVPRLVRATEARIAAKREALLIKLGREPNEQELVAAGANITSMRVRGMGSLDDVAYMNDSGYPVRHGQLLPGPVPPEERQKSTDQIFRELLRSLSMREQTIAWLYWVEEATMKQIAVVLKLSESRVSQMTTHLLAQLRERMPKDEAFALLRV